MNAVLFDELGFRGDEQNYHDPANSCLDQVMSRRLGMPITLSVIYLEISRRLGRAVEGLAMPSHFLLRFNEEEVPVFIDPFRRGELMTDEDCLELIASLSGQRLDFDPNTFPAASDRLIIHRMINNLRASYALQGRPADVARLAVLQQATWSEFSK